MLEIMEKIERIILPTNPITAEAGLVAIITETVDTIVPILPIIVEKFYQNEDYFESLLIVIFFINFILSF
jgi:hypothetical protein